MPFDRRRSLALHLATLVIAGAVLAYLNRHNWFWFDEWEFVHRDVRPLTIDSLLQPHNEHWSTLPVLVYRLLFATVGLHSYAPYIAVLIVAHLMLVHFLWRLLLLVEVQPLVAVALTTVFAVLGAGWENLASAFQIGFIGSLGFAVGGLLILPRVGGFQRRDALYWVFGVASLACSSIGVPGVIVAAIVTLLWRGALTALWVVSAPAVAYVVWYWEFGRQVVTASASAHSFLQLPEFVWHGFVAALEGYSGLVGAGGVLVLAMVVALYREGITLRARGAPAIAMLGGGVAFFVLAGVGRLALGGVEAAAAPRYVYVGMAFLLPAVGVAISRAIGSSRSGTLLVIGALAGSALEGVSGLATGVAHWEVQRSLTRDTILASAQMLRQGVRPLASDADSVSVTWAEPLTVGDLKALVVGARLPTPPPASENARRAAEAGLLIGFSREPRLPAGADPIVGDVAEAVASPSQQPGCILLVAAGPTPMLRLHDTSPASLHVVNDHGGTLGVQYASSQTPTTFVGPRSTTLSPNVVVVLNIGVPGAQPVLLLPAGHTTVCDITLAH